MRGILTLNEYKYLLAPTQSFATATHDLQLSHTMCCIILHTLRSIKNNFFKFNLSWAF